MKFFFSMKKKIEKGFCFFSDLNERVSTHSNDNGVFVVGVCEHFCDWERFFGAVVGDMFAGESELGARAHGDNTRFALIKKRDTVRCTDVGGVEVFNGVRSYAVIIAHRCDNDGLYGSDGFQVCSVVGNERLHEVFGDVCAHRRRHETCEVVYFGVVRGGRGTIFFCGADCSHRAMCRWVR